MKLTHTALGVLCLFAAIGCSTDPPTQRRTERATSQIELFDQLERAHQQLKADAETMAQQQREIKQLTDWIDRFTIDPREMLTKLRAENKALRKRAKDVEFRLKKYRGKYGDGGGPKGQTGVVKSVKGNLVVLSVGSQDGVRNGDTYQIRRGNKYVGQATVTTVYKDQSVGTFDTQFKGPGAPPQAGDAADPRGYGG